MIEEPRQPTIERTDAPTVHGRTDAVVGVLQENVRSGATAVTETAAPLPADYHNVTPEDITHCSPRDLVRFSTLARGAQDWRAVVMFQAALVKLPPDNARANLFLSIALERTGRYADALVVWEHTVSLPNYEPDPQDRYRSARLRAKMTGAAVASVTGVRPVRYDLPSSHMDVTPKMLELCADQDLVRYSMQAQQDEQWDRVEMFEWELVKRQPRNIVAHVVLARAFLKQRKMEDAAALMPTIEELRTPRDDAKITRAIADLQRKLDEAEEKTRARRPPAASSSPALPAPIGPNLDTGSAADSVPMPKKLSNIDASRFDNFLTSIQRTAEEWSWAKGHGEGWRKIPEDESDFFTEAFTEFRKQLERAIPKGPNRAFWGKFDDTELQFQRGAVNVNALATLLERAENAASGAKVDFGRLEPIRIKIRSAGPKPL